MDERKMEFIALMDSILPRIQLEGQFFLRERLSNSQIFGALTTFARGVNPNSVIGMTDSNDSYDGKEGILFSTSAMYCSDAELPNGKHGNVMVLYRDLVNASFSGSLLSARIDIEVKNLPFSSFPIPNTMPKSKRMALYGI